MININSIVSVLPKNQIIIKSNKNKVKNYSGFNKLNVLSKEDTIQKWATKQWLRVLKLGPPFGE